MSDTQNKTWETILLSFSDVTEVMDFTLKRHCFVLNMFHIPYLVLSRNTKVCGLTILKSFAQNALQISKKLIKNDIMRKCM